MKLVGGLILAGAILAAWLHFAGVTLSDQVYAVNHDGHELRITYKDRFPDYSSLEFEICQNGQRRIGPGYLGVYDDTLKFDSLVLPTEGVVAVFERSKPHVLLIIYDTSNGDLWPNGEESEKECKERLCAKIYQATGKKFVFCDLNSSRFLDLVPGVD